MAETAILNDDDPISDSESLTLIAPSPGARPTATATLPAKPVRQRRFFPPSPRPSHIRPAVDRVLRDRIANQDRNENGNQKRALNPSSSGGNRLAELVHRKLGHHEAFQRRSNTLETIEDDTEPGPGGKVRPVRPAHQRNNPSYASVAARDAGPNPNAEADAEADADPDAAAEPEPILNADPHPAPVSTASILRRATTPSLIPTFAPPPIPSPHDARVAIGSTTAPHASFNADTSGLYAHSSTSAITSTSTDTSSSGGSTSAGTIAVVLIVCLSVTACVGLCIWRCVRKGRLAAANGNGNGNRSGNGAAEGAAVRGGPMADGRAVDGVGGGGRDRVHVVGLADLDTGSGTNSGQRYTRDGRRISSGNVEGLASPVTPRRGFFWEEREGEGRRGSWFGGSGGGNERVGQGSARGGGNEGIGMDGGRKLGWREKMGWGSART